MVRHKADVQKTDSQLTNHVNSVIALPGWQRLSIVSRLCSVDFWKGSIKFHEVVVKAERDENNDARS
jgi:hypothetical protein